MEVRRTSERHSSRSSFGAWPCLGSCIQPPGCRAPRPAACRRDGPKPRRSKGSRKKALAALFWLAPVDSVARHELSEGCQAAKSKSRPSFKMLMMYSSPKGSCPSHLLHISLKSWAQNQVLRFQARAVRLRPQGLVSASPHRLVALLAVHGAQRPKQRRHGAVHGPGPLPAPAQLQADALIERICQEISKR